METEEQPAPVWKLSMLARALVDFDIMLESENTAPFFRNLETIKDLHQEQRRLTDRLNIFYAVTFIGALLVLSGPLPSDAKISAFGFETPLGVLPQQIIAVMTAVAYSMYGSNFASLLLITQMIARVLRKEEPEGWHFIGARYDGSTLWATLLTPRRVGYASPKRHFAIAILILLVSSLAVLKHSFVVLVAAALAFWSALEKDAWLLAAFGGLALIIVAMTTITLLLAVALRLPFRRPVGVEETLSDAA